VICENIEKNDLHVIEVQYKDDGIRQMIFFSYLFHAPNIVFFFCFEGRVEEEVALRQNLTY
jgi:hypothetical protein